MAGIVLPPRSFSRNVAALVPPRHRIALTAIVKDEADALLEWVAYHRLIGVEHFYLYDNGSRDGTAALLARLQAAGVATAIDWPSPRAGVLMSFPETLDYLAGIDDARAVDWRAETGVGPQLTAYNDALARFGAGTEWMLFIDADEFLALKEDASLQGFLDRFADPAVGAVALNWRYFGSAGQLEPDGRLVIERFTRCAPPGFGGHHHVKTLARTAALRRMLIHGAVLGAGYGYVDDLGRPLVLRDHAFSPGISHARAQLNHYSVKSLAEFRRKVARGLAPYADDHPNKWQGLDDAYFRRQDLNDDGDESLLPLAAAVRAEMARLA